MFCQEHGEPVGVSTGIHGGLTFGHGELDTLGYWEVECMEARIKHENKRRAEEKWAEEQINKWLSKW